MNQTPPRTTVTTSTPSSSSFSVSGLQSFSVPPFPTTCGFLSQKEMCTFKILPANSSKEPIVVTCAKVPPRPPTKVVTAAGTFTVLQTHPPATPMNLISLKPSTGRGAELGVKTVTVSAVPVGPSEVLVHHRPASPQTNTTTIQTPAGTIHRPPPPPPAPPGSEVTPVPPPCPPTDSFSPEPELACDLVDLDIVCVDEKTGLATTEMVGRAKQSPDAVEGMPSSETENSSDFGDESDSEEEKIVNYHVSFPFLF